MSFSWDGKGTSYPIPKKENFWIDSVLYIIIIQKYTDTPGIGAHKKVIDWLSQPMIVFEEAYDFYYKTKFNSFFKEDMP